MFSTLVCVCVCTVQLHACIQYVFVSVSGGRNTRSFTLIKVEILQCRSNVTSVEVKKYYHEHVQSTHYVVWFLLSVMLI